MHGGGAGAAPAIARAPVSSTAMTPDEKARLVKRLAQEAGFDRAGITAPESSPHAAYYRDWLARGYAGSMSWLRRNVPQRENPALLLPGTRSIVVVALNYRRAEDAPGDEPSGRVAQYARGRDYHEVLHERLAQLAAAMREALPEAFECRACVDTAPLLERDLAASAGVGWVGKNTLILDQRLGSYLFLGELLTTLELTPDAPISDHCGSCTRCLDACPTQAFPEPYRMDASRCIAYLTIERRQDAPEALRAAIGDWVFGCDICQDVCPFNSRAPLGNDADLAQPRIAGRIPLQKLTDMTAGDYRRLTRGTAARRATRAMWQRNARLALENVQRRLTSADGDAVT